MQRDTSARRDETYTVNGGRVEQYPRFPLKVLPDDFNEPTEFTIMPRGQFGEQTTAWVTAAAEDAIDVREVA